MSVTDETIDAQNRVQTTMADMIDQLDKSHLRKLQLKMHLCAADCCKNSSASLDDTHKCVEDCSFGVQRAQNYVQGEIGSFQERLQRCILDCQDSAKDKLGPNPTEQDADVIKRGFEKCAINCVNQHISLVPQFIKKVKSTLDSMK